MSRLFISHSSADNAEAVAIRDWLASEGWNEVFLDLDPDRGIVAGERWESALNEAASRCEAVLFLISHHWLDSRWCLKEFNLARKLNKRLFGILIEPVPFADLPPDLMGSWQIVDLASGQDHTMLSVVVPRTQEEKHVTFSKEGLTRLRNGLAKAGLDARFFTWPPRLDPDRPPYRGLKPLEAEDAGIFFGRDAPIIEALDTLRGLSESAAPRLLAVLGASGAGKSSFLRAGLLPRLARDDLNFLPLPVIRPDRAAISGETGLLRALETAFAANGIAQSRAGLRDAVAGGADQLRPLLTALVDKVFAATLADKSEHKPPIIVLAIDQAEELFVSDGLKEGQTLLELVRDLIQDDKPSVLVLFTIRSDSYDRLETAKALEGIRQRTLPLLPMPRGAYQTVIERPAARLRETNRSLTIDPALTQRLLEDIEKGGGSDALPLLAFTLEQLYIDYGGSGALKLPDYEKFGGIRGAIEAAVERALTAADADPRIPRDRQARLALLRRGLIPWLAGIDQETGSPRRRVAKLADIPEEAAPIIHLLVEQRLLLTDRVMVRDGDKTKSEITIEPAHEALLRQWGLLHGWLDEDFVALSTLEGVKRAARDWAANDRRADWLSHSGTRLEDAEKVAAREDLAGDLSSDAHDYLVTARKREESEQRERLARLEQERDEQQRRLRDAQALAAANRRIAQRSGIGLVAALFLAAFAGWQWFNAHTQTDLARRQTEIARQQTRIAQSETERAELAAREADAQKDQAVQARSGALAAVANERINTNDVTTGTLLALEAATQRATPELETVLINGQLHLREFATLPGYRTNVHTAYFSPDGHLIVSASGDRADIWDADTQKLVAVLAGHDGSINDAAFSHDGKHVATVSEDKTARIWDARSGKSLAVLTGHTARTLTVAFSPDDSMVLTASNDKTARIWDANSGQLIRSLEGHTDGVTSAAFSPDGTRVLTTSNDKTAAIWNTTTGQRLAQLKGHTEKINMGGFQSDGNRYVVTASVDSTARVWDAATGRSVAVLTGHTGSILTAYFIPGTDHVITASFDSTARIWDATNGSTIAVLNGHKGIVDYARASLDGRYIVTASTDNTARVWDAGTGASIATLAGHTGWVRIATFSPDGQRILTGAQDQTIRLWGEQGKVISTGRGSSSTIWRVGISPDGRRIVAPSRGNTAALWDAETGKMISVLRGHSKPVTSASFDPRGRRVATGSEDYTARIWDIVTGTSIVLEGHEDNVIGATFSPDGTRLVTASLDKTARIWDAATGKQLFVLSGHEGTVAMAVFSPDGSRVATVSPTDRTVRMWDAATGKLLEPLIREDREVHSVTFSPDGKKLVTTGLEASATTVHAVDTGDVIMKLQGYASRVVFSLFSPDGSRLFTASQDGATRIWDAASGRLISILAGSDGAVWSIAISADGKRLLTASGADTLRVWHFNSKLEDLVSDLKSVLPRCLTLNERTNFGLAPLPPDWCFNLAKWPYQTSGWQIWRGYRDDTDKPPPFPTTFEWRVWLHETSQRLTKTMPQEALRLLGESVKLSRDEVADNKEDDQAQRRLAGGLVDTGFLLKKLGRSQEALVPLLEALPIVEAQGADLTKAAVWATGAGEICESIADIMTADGKKAEAASYYRRDLAIRQKLQASAPDDPDRIANLAYVNEQLGEALLALGNYDEALTNARDGLANRKKIAAAQPDNTDRQNNVSILYRLIGDVLLAKNNTTEALRNYQESRTIRQRIVAAKGNDIDALNNLAFIDERFADALLADGKKAEAITIDQEMVELRRKIAAAVPDDASRQKDAVRADEKLGQALAGAGRGDDAVNQFRDAFSIREKLSASIEREETTAAGKPGAKTGDSLGGTAWYALLSRNFDKALAISQRASELAPDAVWIKTNLAHALMFLGRTSEARAVYLEYVHQQTFPGKTWEDSVVEDFVEFRKLGLTDPLMDDVKRLFAEKK